MSKFCMTCGSELDDNAIFCDECGAPQEMQQNSHNVQENEKTKKGTVEGKQQSGFGIASFIFGIISIITFGAFFFPEIIGIAFGIAGIKDKSKKTGLAKAGLIMSIIGMVILILMFVLVLALG